MVTSKHQKAMATRNTAHRVAFGSCQERLMFPAHFAHDRTGNTLHALCAATQLGPGSYDNHRVGSLVYDLQHRTESKRGYVLAARTAQRFLPPVKTSTPSPQKYQQDWARPKAFPPAAAAFNSSTLRFSDKPETIHSSPGPGAYAHDTILNKKVSWPMKFGSPDWSKVPLLEKKALRTELFCDRDFRKQRNRVAYLSLFY